MLIRGHPYELPEYCTNLHKKSFIIQSLYLYILFFFIFNICELSFNRDLAHCWRAFDMSNKYYLLTYLRSPKNVDIDVGRIVRKYGSWYVCLTDIVRCCWLQEDGPLSCASAKVNGRTPSSDEELFIQRLYDFMEEKQTPIGRIPTLGFQKGYKMSKSWAS